MYKRLFSLFWLLAWSAVCVAKPPLLQQADRFDSISAEQGMVVTAEPHASEAGLAVLQAGGNAVDAAVTIGFVLAVTLPRAGNIGGGGFMLLRSAADKQIVALDYREMAPNKAHRDMFLTNDEPNTHLSRYTHLAAGVPGTVAGLALALERYGTLSLAEALAPAIKLAEEGFVVSPRLARGIFERAFALLRHPASQAVFFKADGSRYQAGDVFKQPELAKTLKLIAQKGPQAFYQGEIADLIVAEMQQHGGYITHEDLAQYRAVLRKPVHGTYRGYDVYSMSPPSSGGVHIVQLLNILENFDLAKTGSGSAATIHIMAEAMKFAYADRAKFLGDTDFVTVPIAGLTDKAYAKNLAEKIDLNQVNNNVSAGNPMDYESHETTHFSVMDAAGNMVANTYTLNFSFGSGIVVAGAGFLLNNEMDDFSSKPNAPNAYGLVGGEANAIEPKKRMLSSMSPTLVLRDGKPVLITGSPGGSQIITTTLQIIVNVIDHQMNIQAAVNAPRFHHQWLPNILRVEKDFSPDTLALLSAKGHQIEEQSAMGGAASILIDGQTYYGAADPRRGGLAVGF